MKNFASSFSRESKRSRLEDRLGYPRRGNYVTSRDVHDRPIRRHREHREHRGAREETRGRESEREGEQFR